MIAPIAAIGLAGLAAAAPAATTGPFLPPTSQSTGFNLVLNVTDPSRDLTPSVHNTFVTSIHVGAAINYVGQSSNSADARLFYVNGTAADVRFNNANVLSDSGTQPFPEGLSLKADGSDVVSTLWLNGGSGDHGIGLAGFPNPIPELYPATFVACKERLQYYGNQEFVIIKQAKTTISADGQVEYNIPDGCAPLALLPQCATLNELPATGSLSSHEFAANDRCYEDVASINWPEYHYF